MRQKVANMHARRLTQYFFFIYFFLYFSLFYLFILFYFIFFFSFFSIFFFFLFFLYFFYKFFSFLSANVHICDQLLPHYCKAQITSATDKRLKSNVNYLK